MHSAWLAQLVKPAPKKKEKGKKGEKKAPGEKRVRQSVYNSNNQFYIWFEQMPSRLNEVNDNRLGRWFAVAKKMTDAALTYLTSALGTTAHDEQRCQDLWKLGTFDHK
jgi:hypothetical protein